MKILMVHHIFSPYGGGEEVMINEAELLEKNGHEVFFFATDKKPYFRSDYKYAKYFVKYSDFKLSLSSMKNFLRIFYNFEAKKNLDLLIKEIKPDIVHCHNIFYYLSPSVIKACRKNNIPVVLTCHDSRLMCPSAELAIKNKVLCTEMPCVKGSPIHCLTNRCKNGSLAKSIIVTAESFVNRSFKLFDDVSMFIFPSEALYKVACKSNLPKEKLVVLNNFALDSSFEKQPVYKNKGYFLYVGRLEKIKGVNLLLEAMSRLPHIKLHIAGSGKEEEYLKNKANELNLPNVNFLGYTTGEALEKEYQNCIGIILPTNWFENFPVSLIESCVYGKPIIGSNIGGIPELVEHNKNGLVFEPGNVEQLTSAIEKLYNDNKLVVEFGKNGRKKADKLYTPKAHYEQLMGIYKEALSLTDRVVDISYVCCGR